MPLVPADLGPPVRAPWRGLVVGAVAALVFVFGLAIAARVTRDSAGAVPRELSGETRAGPSGSPSAGAPSTERDPIDLVMESVDAGPVRDIPDAGAIDARAAEMEGPQLPPVEVTVLAPPIDARGVAAVFIPVVEKCLPSALRFDPALGGRMRFSMVVSTSGAITIEKPDAASPVLTTCIADNADTLFYEPAPLEEQTIDATLIVDGMRGTVQLLDSSLR